jgi:hypothetical protein
MPTRVNLLITALLTLALSLVPARGVPAAGQDEAIGQTPPRLSYAAGDVSFWRPGSRDWAPARVNTPLAPGDELYTGDRGNVELQVGGRAFVRAWGDTHFGLSNQEPDFLQLKVTSGHVSLDLRGIDPGRTVELDTPHAAFTIEHAGYYRIDVTQERTSFITRRTGRATATPPGGQAVAIAPSEEIVLEGAATQGAPSPTVQSYVAPELDVWDRWNYARTDQLLDAVSARYVPPSVYGVDELDHYGHWRVVQTYGAVWVPAAMPTGWVPYSSGRWIWDPHFGWTWIDTATWGWAPFHYGRWVFVDSFWAWAPGPLVARPLYAPALVAFFGAPSVQVAIGAPAVSWVALGWGEPLVPWWGGPAFVSRPWWASWGGPRVVNNVVINQTTVVNVTNITTYRNVTVQNAVITVQQEQFGRRAVEEARVAHVDARQLQPVHGPLPVAPSPASFVAATGPTVHPPETVLARPVVATRPPAPAAPITRVEGQPAAPAPRTLGQPPAAAGPRTESQPPAVAPHAENRLPAPAVPRPAPRIVSVPPTSLPPKAPQSVEPMPAPRNVPAPTPAPQNQAVPAPASPAPRSGSVRTPAAVAPAPTRPPFATTGPERPEPPLPPRFEGHQSDAVAPAPGPRPEPQPSPPVKNRGAAESVAPPRTPAVPALRGVAPVPAPQRVEAPHPPARPLPGEPANRLNPGRAEARPHQPEKKPEPEGRGGSAPAPSK